MNLVYQQGIAQAVCGEAVCEEDFIRLWIYEVCQKRNKTEVTKFYV